MSKPFIWQDRLCKVEDGMWLMSAVGRHDDFHFFPREHSKEQAVAGTCPSHGVQVKLMEPITEDRIFLVGTDDSKWVLTGNPMDGGRIEQLTDKPIT